MFLFRLRRYHNVQTLHTNIQHITKIGATVAHMHITPKLVQKLCICIRHLAQKLVQKLRTSI